MHINPVVVKALMILKGLSGLELANIANIPEDDFNIWIDGLDESDDLIEFEKQLEILKYLGISGQGPKSEVVHHWKLHESLFSNPKVTYMPLLIVLRTFGGAQAVFLAPESDPYFSMNSKAVFGLKFEDFSAILEVTSHPFRPISFDPEMDFLTEHLSWVPDSLGVLLSEEEFKQLRPAKLKPQHLNQYLTYTSEMSNWDKLKARAIEKGIKAEDIVNLLIGYDPSFMLENQSKNQKELPLNGLSINSEDSVAADSRNTIKKPRGTPSSVIDLPEDIVLFSSPLVKPEKD